MNKLDGKVKIIIGVSALVGLAGAIYFLTKGEDKNVVAIKEEELDDDDKKLIVKIKSIGPVIKQKNGSLDYEYLLKFCDVVGKHAKEKQDCCKADLVIRRRDSMKKNDDEGY